MLIWQDRFSPAILLALALAAGLGAVITPAVALDGETSLNGKTQDCTFKGEGMICKGLGGWRVAIGYHGLNSSIAFMRPGKALGENAPPPADSHDLHILSVGPPDRAYWHGASVTIPIQVLSRAENDKLIETGGALPRAEKSRTNVLAVFRLGGEGVCTVAYLAGQNPKDSKLAGEAAAYADTARCPVASIRIFGHTPPALASYWKD